MTQLTRQKAFDKALFGIRGQDYKQSSHGAICAYRGSEGTKCAIGHCIDDATAKVWDRLEKTAIINIEEEDTLGFARYFSYEDLPFLNNLQTVHDQPYMSVVSFEKEMKGLAESYDLIYTPV